MHRTRIGSLVIDCHDLKAGVAFWTAALDVHETKGDVDTENYVSLGPVVGGLRLLLQRVPDQKTCKSRLHLDIETDDVARETARLRSLGAEVVVQRSEGDAVLAAQRQRVLRHLAGDSGIPRGNDHLVRRMTPLRTSEHLACQRVEGIRKWTVSTITGVFDLPVGAEQWCNLER